MHLFSSFIEEYILYITDMIIIK